MCLVRKIEKLHSVIEIFPSSLVQASHLAGDLTLPAGACQSMARSRPRRIQPSWRLRSNTSVVKLHDLPDFQSG
jgi:hypothetical protein